MTHPFAAGALCSTVGDLVKWQRALMGGSVVNAQSYALMTTPDTLNNGRPINYGFGLVPGSSARIGKSGTTAASTDSRRRASTIRTTA